MRQSVKSFELALRSDPILVNDKSLETVSTVKLVGLNISSDLKWNHHTSEITRKAAPRFYFISETAHQKSKHSDKRTANFLFYMHSPNT